MAQIQLEGSGKTVSRNVSIDMTPMVDLGFLLITFFIFTTTMTQKNAMNLFMPKESGTSPLPESKALTIVLGQHNKIFAYQGKWEDALKQSSIQEMTYDERKGLGSLLRQKQKMLREKGIKDDEGLMLLIKPLEQSSYKNVIDALDETAINNIKRYAIISPTQEERSYFHDR